jgi:hypothetical protein
MKRRRHLLLLAVGITATAILLPRLIRKLGQKPIPDGWDKTFINIRNIEAQGNGYAYTLTYPYQVNEETKTMEQNVLDDRKPVESQFISAIYSQKEPVLFELLELIQYE